MSRFIRWRMTNPEDYQRLLDERKKRYAEDDDFRRKQLEYSATWKERQKNPRRPKKGSRPERRAFKPRVFEIDGKQVEFWSIGRVSEVWGVCTRTITNLEETGSIPVNRLTIRRRRWWPVDFVLWLKPFFESRQAGISAQEFHRRVWIAWTEAQIAGKVTVVASAESETDDAASETEERSG